MKEESIASTFKRFDRYYDVLGNQKEIKYFPLFTNKSSSISMIYTSSFQTNIQKQYYLDVVSSPNSKDVEFSIAYGHINGSGSLSGSTELYPSKAIYSQYKQLLLEPGETLFKFKDGTSTNHIYVINFKRERFKQRIDPGNWEIGLTRLKGNQFSNNTHTGSNILVNEEGTGEINFKFSLSDDSKTIYDSTRDFLTPNYSNDIIYKIGSYKTTYTTLQYIYDEPINFVPVTSSFGKIYPYHGVIILDANKLNTFFNFNTVTGSNISGDNPLKLFRSLWGNTRPIKGIEVPIVTPSTYYTLPPSTIMSGRGNEIVQSSYYYCRVKKEEYNYTNNPSFTTGSDTEIKKSTMINDPKVYITTVGLYNNRQELLAVAKFSRPILKTFERELNLTVKVNW